MPGSRCPRRLAGPLRGSVGLGEAYVAGLWKTDDLGNDLFAAFLDERMMYSCAYFPAEGTSLGQAQLAKLERICERLRLGPDDELLAPAA